MTTLLRAAPTAAVALLATLAALLAPHSALAQSGQSAISLKRAVIVATGADPDAGSVQLMEKLLVQNDTGAAYQPDRPESSALKLAVPAGARNVTLESGPTGAGDASLARAGQWYTLASPLPPGEQSLVLSYDLPYSERPGAATLRVAHPLAMPAASVQVMVPAVADVQVRAVRVLGAAQPISMGGQRYNVLEAAQLDAGASVDFELSGLPAAGETAAARGAAQTAFAGATLPDGALLAATGAVLAAGLVYGLWRPAVPHHAPVPVRALAPAAQARKRRR